MGFELDNDSAGFQVDDKQELPSEPISTAPAGFEDKVSSAISTVVSPIVENVGLTADIASGKRDAENRVKAYSRMHMTPEQKKEASRNDLLQTVIQQEKEAKEFAERQKQSGPPVSEYEALQIGVNLAGLTLYKPITEISAALGLDDTHMNDSLDQYLKTVDARLKGSKTTGMAYITAKGIEFLPNIVGGLLAKESVPLLMTTEFITGAGYESTSVYPDAGNPGEFRTATLPEMLMAGGLNSLVAGSVSAVSSGYKAYKEAGGFIPMFSSKNVQDILTTNPEQLSTMVDTVKLKDKGISLENYLVTNQGAVMGETGTSIKDINLWENRDAALKMYKTNKKLVELSEDAFESLHKVSKPVDIMDWKQLTEVQQTIKTSSEKLNKAYTDIVNEAYAGAEAGLKSVNHIKINSDDLVYTTQDIFDVSPTSVTTAIKPLLDKTTNKLGMTPSKIKKVYSDYVEAEMTLNSARGSLGAARTPMQKVRARKAYKLAENNFNKLHKLKSRLDKAHYEFSLGSMEQLRKLVNHKIYVPGQNVSMNDRLALKALQDIKHKIDDTMKSAISSNKELLEASLPLMQARKLASDKASKFGMSSDNTFLMDLVIKGDDKALDAELRNPETGLRVVKFIGDTFGKDSEAFQAATRHYIESKVTGLSTIGVTEAVKQTDKAFATTMVDPARFAAAYNSITKADINLIRGTYGNDVASQFNGLKNFSGSYANFVKFLKDKEVPISAKGIILQAPIQAISDAMTYYGRKLVMKAVDKAPLTRALTGAAFAGGMDVNNQEGPIDLESVVSSMATGAIVGHYGGRIVRNLIEPDITKVVRYINQGKHLKAKKAMEDLVKVIDDQGGTYINKDLTLRQALKKDISPYRSIDSVIDSISTEGIKAGAGGGVAAVATVANDRNASKEEVLRNAAIGAAAPTLIGKMLK